MTQTTKQPTTPKHDGNMIFDRVLQVLGILAILALAYCEILRHVHAAAGMNYPLAGLGLSALLYVVLAPRFRK